MRGVVCATGRVSGEGGEVRFGAHYTNYQIGTVSSCLPIAGSRWSKEHISGVCHASAVGGDNSIFKWSARRVTFRYGSLSRQHRTPQDHIGAGRTSHKPNAKCRSAAAESFEHKHSLFHARSLGHPEGIFPVFHTWVPATAETLHPGIRLHAAA
jgi:hypothetical protein